jgi:IS30 family transposase
MTRTYKQLSAEERDRLSFLKAQGDSLRTIAVALGRDVSTISRELKRNTVWDPEGYLPHKAQWRADLRKTRAHERERLRKPGLKSFVTRMLRQGWSPERIAGRWKRLGHEPISHEAIYQWVYAEAGNMVPFLLRAHRRRKRRLKPKKHTWGDIPSRTSISQRPQAAQLRQEPGHWEGDTMVSRKSKCALQVLVERKTRFTRLRKLPAKTAASVRRTVSRALLRYPKHLRRSITYDNGSENSQHLAINRRLGTESYFCGPMRSWEKGSVENVAGLVRRHLPKKTDFAIVSPRQLRKTEHWLNSVPRKCLGFQTPAEAFRKSVALTG